MACYCGIGTKRNKIRWALVALFGVISLCLLIATVVKNQKCSDQLNDLDIRTQRALLLMVAATAPAL